MTIDFHAHCFPEKIADKALDVLRHRSGILDIYHGGSELSLIESMKNNGVDVSVVLNIATNPTQQRKVNDFAVEINSHPELVAFGSVHPDSPDIMQELERLSAAGIKGVKLHPDYQDFFVDEERMFPVYEKIGSLGMITTFHCGVDIGFPHPVHCTPDRLAKVLPIFGGAPVVAAHFGGIGYSEDVCTKLTGFDNLYIDTAYSYGIISPYWAKKIIAAHGAEHILFASDTPWSSPKNEQRLLDCFDLTTEEKSKILGENARRLLGI